MAMNTTHQHAKRSKPELLQTISQTNSNDHDFLTPNETYGNVNVLLILLITGRIINSSFSSLYQRSKSKGWKDLFIEEQKKLKSDEKSKLKRFMLNRLIEQCSESFDQEVQQLIEEIENHMSDIIPTDWIIYTRPTIVDEIYNQVKSWRKLQNQRRLFHKERLGVHSLFILQQAITDHFLHLVYSSNNDPHFFQNNGRKAFMDLFDHCLIIVAQPTGLECLAAIKYEKVGKEYVTKIKTRIICLIDPDRAGQYLKLSAMNVKLCPRTSKTDSEGDIQSPLKWVKRTITYAKNKERSFLFSELTENDSIRLTKMNSKNKPAYNKVICQLEYQTKIKLIGTDIEKDLTFNSKSFGLCSHSKYFPQYLAQIFIEEVDKMCKDTDSQSHSKRFAEYINLYHKRVCGIEMNSYSREFIETELEKYYTPPCETSNIIYKDILEKIMTQIKYMSNHPFLSMLYYDKLFHGICNHDIDQEIANGSLFHPQMLIRFDKLDDQVTTKNPNLIFVIHNGELRIARITHNRLIHDMCKCFCEAAENIETQSQVFHQDKNLPFKNFSWYYDIDLDQSNVIQTEDGTNFYQLERLLRDTMRNNRRHQSEQIANNLLPNPMAASVDQSELLTETTNEQSTITYTVNLSAEITGNTNLTSDVVGCLQEAFSQWCLRHNAQGYLSTILLPQVTELIHNNDISNYFDDDDEFNMFLP